MQLGVRGDPNEFIQLEICQPYLTEIMNRRFFHKSYLDMQTRIYLGREMHRERLADFSQLTCEHAKQRHYTQTRFDILNGFELNVTKCCNCHKTLALKVKKLN